MTMSKTFGKLHAGDEVYVIKGSNVKIVKVQSIEVATRQKVYITIEDRCFLLSVDQLSVYDDVVDNIYISDIDKAIKRMKEICENALHDYLCARSSLNLLEGDHKITKEEYERMLAQVAQSEILWETKKKTL